MSSALSITGCSLGNAGIRCPSSNKEPLCKEPIANPATRFSFDPDNCASINSSVLQTALEELCNVTAQTMCASAGATQSFIPNGGSGGGATTSVITDVIVQKVLGTTITVTTPQIIFGSTGTYYLEATLAYQTTNLATPGVIGFLIEQGNTDATFAPTAIIKRSQISVVEQDETIKIQGIICVTDIAGNDRDNEIRLVVSSDATLEGVFLVPATVVIHKISSVPCRILP